MITVMNPARYVLAKQELNIENITVLQLQQADGPVITMINAYFKFAMPTNNNIEELNAILYVPLNYSSLSQLIKNVHSTLWHPKGKNVKRFLDWHDLHVVNTRLWQHTFSNARPSKNFDITVASLYIDNNIVAWTNRTDVTNSDHEFKQKRREILMFINRQRGYKNSIKWQARNKYGLGTYAFLKSLPPPNTRTLRN